MSYTNTIEYRIRPIKSYELVKNCAGCGCKERFHNTNCFRVNANGNKLDVWLIYQCTKCKHTYNLSVYERRRPDSIPKDELSGFQNNSIELAMKYGTDIGFFTRNRAEIAWEHMEYKLEAVHTGNSTDFSLHSACNILVHNESHIKVRPDKLLAEIMDLSRNKIQEMMQNGSITITANKNSPQIEIGIHQSIK